MLFLHSYFFLIFILLSMWLKSYYILSYIVKTCMPAIPSLKTRKWWNFLVWLSDLFKIKYGKLSCLIFSLGWTGLPYDIHLCIYNTISFKNFFEFSSFNFWHYIILRENYMRITFENMIWHLCSNTHSGYKMQWLNPLKHTKWNEIIFLH